MSRKPESTQLEAEMVSLCKYPDHDDGWNAIATRKLDRGQMRIHLSSLYCIPNKKKTQQNKQTKKRPKKGKKLRAYYIVYLHLKSSLLLISLRFY